MNEGIIEGSFNQKQDFRMKQLENYQKIYNKKLKYDIDIRHNKSESKELKKYISEITTKKEKIYEHYFKVEKELLEYIALLQTRIYALKKNESNLKDLKYYKMIKMNSKCFYININQKMIKKNQIIFE